MKTKIYYTVVCMVVLLLGNFANAQGCFVPDADDKCLSEGDVWDEWDVGCDIHTIEGTVPGTGTAQLIAENDANMAAVTFIEYAPWNGWGVDSVIDSISYTAVNLKLVQTDPDDCSVMEIPISGFSSTSVTCHGLQLDLLFGNICW
jgi:hypothetical protein